MSKKPSGKHDVTEKKQEVAHAAPTEKKSRNRNNTTPIDNSVKMAPMILSGETLSVKERFRKCRVNKSVKTIFDCQNCTMKKNIHRAACVRDSEIVEA